MSKSPLRKSTFVFAAVAVFLSWVWAFIAGIWGDWELVTILVSVTLGLLWYGVIHFRIFKRYISVLRKNKVGAAVGGFYALTSALWIFCPFSVSENLSNTCQIYGGIFVNNEFVNLGFWAWLGTFATIGPEFHSHLQEIIFFSFYVIFSFHLFVGFLFLGAVFEKAARAIFHSVRM